MMEKLSLRERNKHEKLLRIKVAAEQLFMEQGFDAATTRQIAERAQVGLATLFLYASDKRDLLFLVCNDALEQLAEDAFDDTPADASLLGQLTVACRHFFIHYAKNRQLSRDLLRELTFYTTGKQSERFQQIRARNISKIREIIVREKQMRHIRATADCDLVAQMIFYLLAAELRHWLSIEGTTPEAGVQQLRRMLEVLIDGLQSNDGAAAH